MASLAGAKTFNNGIVLERAAKNVLLNAVAGGTTGTGDEDAFPALTPNSELPDTFTLQSIVSGGTLTSISVNIEISLDGINWVASGITLTTVGGEVRFVSGMKFRYIRANITASVTAAGSPLYSLFLTF